jgi:CBS domain-containing protein
MKVKEAMNKVVTIDHDLSLKEAAKIMSDKNIGSLVITKKDEILGIITENDIVKNAANLDKKISSAMSKNIISIDQEESLDLASTLMAENKIKRLPVTHGDKLAGIITATDLIANSEELEEDFIFD